MLTRYSVCKEIFEHNFQTFLIFSYLTILFTKKDFASFCIFATVISSVLIKQIISINQPTKKNKKKHAVPHSIQFDSILSWTALSRTAFILTQRCPGQRSSWHSANPKQCSAWFSALPNSTFDSLISTQRSPRVWKQKAISQQKGAIFFELWIRRLHGYELSKQLDIENLVTLILKRRERTFFGKLPSPEGTQTTGKICLSRVTNY